MHVLSSNFDIARSDGMVETNKVSSKDKAALASKRRVDI